MSQDIPPRAALLVDAEGARLTGTVLRLAWPVVVEHVSISVLSIIDALLVGRFVGSDGVAAVGIGALLFWVPFSGALGVSIASTAVVARDAGAGAFQQVERSIRAALAVAILWGALATLSLVLLAGLLMKLMAAEADVKPLGVDYMRTGALGFPFLMMLYATNGCLRGLGNTWLPMVMLILVNIANAIITFLLISGVFGLPKMGVLASGVGFASAGTLGGLLAMGLLVSGLGPTTYHPSRALQVGTHEFRRLLTVGIPVFLEEFQFMFAFIIYTRIITGLGTTATAAHTLALRALELAIVPGFALGTAATAIVGQCLGAGLPDQAERAGLEARKWAVASMVVLGAVLALFAPQIVGLFVDDDEVIEMGGTLLRIFSLAFPMMGVHGALAGSLRGAGDVRYVLGVLTVTAWLVRIPTALILAGAFGLGAPGAWVGAVLENNVRGALVWHRFRRGKWKQIKI